MARYTNGILPGLIGTPMICASMTARAADDLAFANKGPPDAMIFSPTQRMSILIR
ncbi:MAG: hypothetical protein J0H94_09265 [Rhizobiales bacterium]|nr:hypothetical protein [Hyphomicrobiales bacterium]